MSNVRAAKWLLRMARRSEDLAYLNQNISLALFLLYGDDFDCSCNTELKKPHQKIQRRRIACHGLGRQE